MTVGDWLRSRQPVPPSALSAHLEVVLGDSLRAPASESATVLMDACERLAAALVGSDSDSRASALDLLTADALVTYAFEAAAECPEEIAPRATDAMHRIAVHAAAAAR